MSLTNFIDLIKQQRNNYPTAAKNHYFKYLPKYNFTAESVFNTAITLTTARLQFVTLTSFDKPLYPDVDDLIYAEFVDKSFGPKLNLDKWRYIYIPQSMFNNLVNTLTFAEIYFPFVYKYLISSQGIIQKVRPYEPYLFRFNKPISYSYVKPNIINTHPFSKNFKFTGIYYLHKTSGNILYEYRDLDQLHDFQDITYFSNFRPTFFNILSSSISSLVKQQTETKEERELRIPQAQTWVEGENYELYFTDEQTTNKFSTKKSWFSYFFTDTIDDLSLEITNTIRDTKPVQTNYDFVKIFLGQTMGLKLKSISNTQSLTYNQNNTPSILKIGTNNL